MPFTVEDFHDLLRLLEAHADWSKDLRRVVLTDELLSLPKAVRALAEQVTALTVAQRRTDDQVAALTEQVAALTQRTDTLSNHVAALRGSDLERRFADRAPSYLSPSGYRRVRVISNADLADLLDAAVDTGRVTVDEREDLLRADAVVRARDEQSEAWFAVELSATVDEGDVARARRRAKVLVRLYGRAGAVVGGYAFTDGARRELADPAVLALTLPAT